MDSFSVFLYIVSTHPLHKKWGSGLGYSTTVSCLPSVPKALGFSLSTTKSTTSEMASILHPALLQLVLDPFFVVRIWITQSLKLGCLRILSSLRSRLCGDLTHQSSFESCFTSWRLWSWKNLALEPSSLPSVTNCPSVCVTYLAVAVYLWVFYTCHLVAEVLLCYRPSTPVCQNKTW